MTTLQPVRGTQSLLGEEADRFHAVIDAFDRVRKLFGFKRVEVPVIEHTAVFARSLGETTDIVSKEMYTFKDKGEDWITLRPEFTAGIGRAYLTGGWKQFLPLRVATDGPAFRYERPQKGRFRQFHQLDAEIIGINGPEADVELLLFADQLLKDLRVGRFKLKLNTLGDAASRAQWRSELIKYFRRRKGELSEDSVRRLKKNPLRILDSKDPRDRRVVQGAPKIKLTNEAADFFERVKEGLDVSEVRYDVDPYLVRGLDYYRHTCFEFVTRRLGAQGTVLGGGRYDGLIESLGGPPTPATGWAAGVERLGMLTRTDLKPFRTAALVIESDDPQHMEIGHFMIRLLRKGRMPTELVADGSVRKRFNKALNLEPDYILVLQPDATGRVFGNLRIKRLFSDTRRRGRVFSALSDFLANRFSVDREQFRATVLSGGDLLLGKPAV